MNLSRWNRLANEHGFIVVYPSGTGVPKAWHMGAQGKGAEALVANVRFISELIDTLEAAYNIDPTRIYADGFSVGGGMLFAVSCRLSDRVAAVGAVSPAEFLPMNWCKGSRPVPMVEFDGTADSSPTRAAHRRSAPDCFRPFGIGWRVGRNETDADRALSNLWSLRMSPVSNTRTVLKTQPWCSIPSREEATPGLAASRFQNGSSGPLAAASTQRVRCGRSFMSIRCQGPSLQRCWSLGRREASVAAAPLCGPLTCA